MLDKQIEEKAKRFRTEVEKSKKLLAQSQGSMMTVLKTMKDSFDIANIDDAKKKEDELVQERSIVVERIWAKIKEVEVKYDMD